MRYIIFTAVVDDGLVTCSVAGFTSFAALEGVEARAQLRFQDLFVDQGQTVDLPESDWIHIPANPSSSIREDNESNIVVTRSQPGPRKYSTHCQHRY